MSNTHDYTKPRRSRAHFCRYTSYGVSRCWKPADTVDIVHGYRCEDHPPRYNRQYARDLRGAGWTDTARAYRRSMIAVLAARIVTRAVSAQLDWDAA